MPLTLETAGSMYRPKTVAMGGWHRREVVKLTLPPALTDDNPETDALIEPSTQRQHLAFR